MISERELSLSVRAGARKRMNGPPGPPPPPPKKTEPKTKGTSVYFPPELWTELDDVAAFHEQVFTEMGTPASVSRNQMMISFLNWALFRYWKDLGGKPKNDRERSPKIEKKIELIRKAQREQDE